MKTEIRIQYVQCVKFTTGQLDCAPHSAYWMADATVILQSLPPCEAGGDEKTDYVVSLNDRIIGEGESPDAAIADAQWRLMDESRSCTKANAIINPAWIEAGKVPHYDYP